MDIKVIAGEAASFFSQKENSEIYSNWVGILYVKSYFEGVAAGIISVGDKRVGDILVVNFAKAPSDKQHQFLEKIFSSGMCVEGQPLNDPSKYRSWTEKS